MGFRGLSSASKCLQVSDASLGTRGCEPPWHRHSTARVTHSGRDQSWDGAGVLGTWGGCSFIHISVNTSGSCNSASCSCKVGSYRRCKCALEKNSAFSQETGEMGWGKKKQDETQWEAKYQNWRKDQTGQGPAAPKRGG